MLLQSEAPKGDVDRSGVGGSTRKGEGSEVGAVVVAGGEISTGGAAAGGK